MSLTIIMAKSKSLNFLHAAAFFCLLLSCLLYNGAHCDETIDEDIPVVEGHGGDIRIAEEGGVIVLDQDNFDLITMSRDLLLVEFYAPWCGHCKKLEPEYSKAAMTLKKQVPPIEIAKIDATKADKIAQRFDVKGYPTILLLKKGEVIETYNEERSHSAIVEFMRKRADPNYKPPPKKVIELTEENFQLTVDNSNLILVFFTAKSCPECKELAKRFEQSAKELDEIHPSIPLAIVDSDEAKSITEKYQVVEFPTFKVFRNGRAFDYLGPQDHQVPGMVSFMRKELSLPSKEAKNNQQFVNNLSKNGLTIMGFFTDDSSPLYKEFLAAAYMMRDTFPFSHSFSKSVASHAQEKLDTIVLFKPEIFQSQYEESKYRISDANLKADALNRFIEEHKIPLVGQRTRENLDLYSKRSSPLCVIYYDVNFSHQYRVASQLVRKQILKVAKDFKDVIFALSNEEEFKSEMEALGLGDSSEDINVALFFSKAKRFVLHPTEEFDTDVLRTFLKDAMAGKLKPLLKSQPLPKKNSGPVKKIVADTFEELVIQSPQSVFLEFYAPWCGFCQKLAPIYKKLGKKYSKDKSVLIAQMDATANDFDDIYDVQGYPTIYFLKSGSKSNPVLYDGEKTLEDMSEFLDKNLAQQKDEL